MKTVIRKNSKVKVLRVNFFRDSHLVGKEGVIRNFLNKDRIFSAEIKMSKSLLTLPVDFLKAV